MSGDADWSEQRGRAIAAHAADLARRDAVEATQAGALLREFVAAAREKGLAPAPLAARSHDGRRRYRTRLSGWYLRADQGLAVAEDGQFYILSVPASLRARLSPVVVPPARPRLVLGNGGRDGERIGLKAALARLLGEDSP
jgi:hypothetical protein